MEFKKVISAKENTADQNATKAVFRGKFIAWNAYIMLEKKKSLKSVTPASILRN